MAAGFPLFIYFLLFSSFTIKLHFLLLLLFYYIPVQPSFKIHLILNLNLMKLHEKLKKLPNCMLVLLLCFLFKFILVQALWFFIIAC